MSYGEAGPGVVIPPPPDECCEDCGELFEYCVCDDVEECGECGETMEDCMCEL